jgi:hypothetical protein
MVSGLYSYIILHKKNCHSENYPNKRVSVSPSGRCERTVVSCMLVRETSVSLVAAITPVITASLSVAHGKISFHTVSDPK